MTLTTEERLERIERLLVMQVFKPLEVKDAAVLLKVSENRIRHLVAAREIPHYRNERGGISFVKEELERWKLGRKVPTNKEIDSRAATYVALNPR